MLALVLSGGGAKGSYQIGVWKALRKLNIKPKIVTGTSVGAINGAIITQNSYYKAKKIWKKLNPEMIFGKNYKNCQNKLELYKNYRDNFFKHGGMDVKSLEKLIEKNLNKRKFYKSKINYGLVTLNISNMKPLKLEKKNISKDKLKDYIIASATCYQAFKVKKIDGNNYIDGGFVDYLPINLAIDMGADEIIAVDLKAPGIKKLPKKNIKITLIKPNNEINNFLDFNDKNSKRNITLGYNDTMKVFNKYEGIKYTFKLGTKKKLIKKVTNNYNNIIENIINNNELSTDLITLIQNYKKIDKVIINLIEKTLEDLKLDETKVYNYYFLKYYLRKQIKKYKEKEKNIKILDNEIDIYQKIINNDYNNLRKLAIIKPIKLLEAICLYAICGELK